MILQGLLFGSAAVIGILYPVTLTPGVFFDGRSVVISLCGLFFGPVPGMIAAGMAIAARLLVGGSGIYMGNLVILSALGIGLTFHYWWKGNFSRMAYWKIYIMGLLVHLVMVGLIFILPHEVAANAFRTISLPVLAFYPITTVIMGKILKDNFEKIQTHRELILQKDKAEQSSRLKDAFIASISHEIRTPLNAILGFVSIIEEEANDRFSAEELVYFQRIDQSGIRLTRTVDEILNYSRLLVKDIKPHKVPINLPALIETLIKESQVAHPNPALNVIFDNSIGEVSVNLDEFCLRNSLSNLLDNAMKYTESGQITIRLFQDRTEQVLISVADTGIGMSEEFLTRIFEPYTQENTGYTRRYEGIGLGLSIVKRLCDIMNARISVVSQKGSGSTFTITLPVV